MFILVYTVKILYNLYIYDLFRILFSFHTRMDPCN